MYSCDVQVSVFDSVILALLLVVRSTHTHRALLEACSQQSLR